MNFPLLELYIICAVGEGPTLSCENLWPNPISSYVANCVKHHAINQFGKEYRQAMTSQSYHKSQR